MNSHAQAPKPQCPRCGDAHTVKSGLSMGKQRYMCRNCHYQFTQRKLHGKPGNCRAMAIAMYSWGLTQTDISRLLKVTVPTVHYWISGFMENNYLKPETAELVTISLNDIGKILPEGSINPMKPIVLVPVDEATGEIAGMIGLSANKSAVLSGLDSTAERQERDVAG